MSKTLTAKQALVKLADEFFVLIDDGEVDVKEATLGVLSDPASVLPKDEGLKTLHIARVEDPGDVCSSRVIHPPSAA